MSLEDKQWVGASNFVSMIHRARTLKAYGTSKKEVFKTLCKMAGNDKGDAYFATVVVFNESEGN
mgnify:CR=1 FL=1